MGILQNTNTLSLDTKYKLFMTFDRKTKPKSEKACDFGINCNTFTMIYKQGVAVIEAFVSSVFSLQRKRMRSGIILVI